MKDLRITKIVKEITFERVWGELEAKNVFLRARKGKKAKGSNTNLYEISFEKCLLELLPFILKYDLE